MTRQEGGGEREREREREKERENEKALDFMATPARKLGVTQNG